MTKPNQIRDAELFDLIAAHAEAEAGAVAAGEDEEENEAEIARTCDRAESLRMQIAGFEPRTLPGVLAALEFAATDRNREDPDYFPEGALAGLRAIVSRGDDVPQARGQR